MNKLQQYLNKLNFQYKEIKIIEGYFCIKFYSSYQAERFLNIISTNLDNFKFRAIPEEYNGLHKFLIQCRIPLANLNLILNKLENYINEFKKEESTNELKVLKKA